MLHAPNFEGEDESLPPLGARNGPSLTATWHGR